MSNHLSLLEVLQNNLTDSFDWKSLAKWPSSVSMQEISNIINTYSPKDVILEIGQANRSLLNQQNQDGETLLHLSILAMNREMIQTLLRFADPIKTYYKANYLHYAYATSQEDIIELITARFPDFPQEADQGGDFPLHWLKYTPRKK